MAEKEKLAKKGKEPVASGQSGSAGHVAASPGVAAVVGVGASAGGLEALEGDAAPEHGVGRAVLEDRHAKGGEKKHDKGEEEEDDRHKSRSLFAGDYDVFDVGETLKYSQDLEELKDAEGA